MNSLKYALLASAIITISTSSAAVIDITTKEQFESIKAEPSKNIIIDFYTDWCPNCTLIKEPLEEVSEQAEYAGITFARINTDQLPDVAKELDIKGLPTIILFKDGKSVDKIVGAKNAATFKEALRASIANQYSIATVSAKIDAITTPAQAESACPFCLKVWSVFKSGLILILDGLTKIIAYIRSLLE